MTISNVLKLLDTARWLAAGRTWVEQYHSKKHFMDAGSAQLRGVGRCPKS
jgi:hypothetical protein